MRSTKSKNSEYRGIVWFRNDIRVEDNEALSEALESCDEIYPVYIYDERFVNGKTAYGFDKIGDNRLAFAIESVNSLRDKLKENYGAELHVFSGISEEILFELAFKLKSKWIFCNRERTKEEVEIQDAIERRLWSIGQEMRYSRGKMLLYTSDLPFPVTHTPERFSIFRKEVSYLPIRQPISAPDEVRAVKPEDAETALPSIDNFRTGPVLNKEVKGGEKEGLEMLEKVLTQLEETKSEDFSLELSPWISQGCLSPKVIYHSLKSVENSSNKEVIDSVIRKLLRRDHHRLMAKKYGNLIFQRSGIQGIQLSSERDPTKIDTWCSGNTDEPLVNAAMKALNKTGVIPFRLRLLVASYFIYQLCQDWLVGAEYFESKLLDYDPCSNYGNWARIAGVGATRKEDMALNMEHQTRLIDPDGVFMERWS